MKQGHELFFGKAIVAFLELLEGEGYQDQGAGGVSSVAGRSQFTVQSKPVL